jgi:type VI secretion system protein ImpA
MMLEGLDLLAPIQPDRPCGENLEDTQLMASLDAYQLFGQPIPPETPPDWNEIRARAVEALARSKDLRALAHLSAASLRADGLTAFLETITVASGWLDLYWADVYPRIDEDAVMRRNALTAFGDQAAVLDGLRRAVIASSRRHGRFGLRDIELASGKATPGEDETPPDQRQIEAAFADTPQDHLAALHQAVLGAIASLTTIDARMREVDAPPAFEPLLAQLGSMERVLAAHVTGAGDAALEGPGAAMSQPGVGVIRSRDDAVRAMQAVAQFFRQNEPSSPVPMLLDRAARLVSKSFLDVLADLAPDAVAQARAAGGIRHDE